MNPEAEPRCVKACANAFASVMTMKLQQEFTLRYTIVGGQDVKAQGMTGVSNSLTNNY